MSSLRATLFFQRLVLSDHAIIEKIRGERLGKISKINQLIVLIEKFPARMLSLFTKVLDGKRFKFWNYTFLFFFKDIQQMIG